MLTLLIVVCLGAAFLAVRRIIAWYQYLNLLKQRQNHFEETGELLEINFFRQNIKKRK